VNNEHTVIPEIPLSSGDDLHGLDYMDSADLVLFMAGNQFMVMDDLLNLFQQEYPEITVETYRPVMFSTPYRSARI